MKNKAIYHPKHPKFPVKLVEHKDRFCLRCDKKFRSYGPQNRLCGRCGLHCNGASNDVVGNGHKRSTSGSNEMFILLNFERKTDAPE